MQFVYVADTLSFLVLLFFFLSEHCNVEMLLVHRKNPSNRGYVEMKLLSLLRVRKYAL